MEGEVRTLRAHEKLLMDVITRQAGTIEKSIMEGVMNSVDADAKTVEVTISSEKLIIQDDGRGMNKEEIKEYFEVFGAPEEREKTFGEFRMGRGQLFAKGKNLWHTNGHRMEADVQNRGLEYTLEDTSESIKGTLIEVEVYDYLHDPGAIANNLSMWLAYIGLATGTKVIINGTEVGSSETYKYQFETKDAWFFLDSVAAYEGIHLYNVGAYVKTTPNRGLRGAVISKSAMKLNFARNDVMGGCPIKKRIESDLREYRIKILADVAHPSQWNRSGMISLMGASDEAVKAFKNKRIFEASNGKLYTWAEMMRRKISFAEDGDITADKVMQEGRGVVLKEDSMIRRIIHKLGGNIVKLDQLASGVRRSDYKTLDVEDLNQTARLNLAIARWFVEQVGDTREVLPGKAPSKTGIRGWTDGSYTIHLDKRTRLNLKRSEFCASGILTVVEEIVHDNDDLMSRVHGPEFYEKYYRFLHKHSSVIAQAMLVPRVQLEKYLQEVE